MTVANTTRSYTDRNLPFSKHLGPDYGRIALGLLMKKMSRCCYCHRDANEAAVSRLHMATRTDQSTFSHHQRNLEAFTMIYKRCRTGYLDLQTLLYIGSLNFNLGTH